METKQCTANVREVVVQYRGPRYLQRKAIADAKDAAAFLRKIQPDNSREHVMILHLDGAHTIIGYSVLTGTASSCLVHPREVFQPAIHLGATAVLISHNHPTGKTEPSTEDNEVTKRLKSASEILGLKLLDHIILGDADLLYSYSEQGVL